jgi:hypothetical protein
MKLRAVFLGANQLLREMMNRGIRKTDFWVDKAVLIEIYIRMRYRKITVERGSFHFPDHVYHFNIYQNCSV